MQLYNHFANLKKSIIYFTIILLALNSFACGVSGGDNSSGIANNIERYTC